jgi:hypothetical protein
MLQIYLFKLCIRRQLHNKESQHQTGHQTIFYYYIIYCNCASGAAPQHGVAAPGEAPDFFIYFFIFICIFYFLNICIRGPLHIKESRH